MGPVAMPGGAHIRFAGPANGKGLSPSRGNSSRSGRLRLSRGFFLAVDDEAETQEVDAYRVGRVREGLARPGEVDRLGQGPRDYQEHDPHDADPNPKIPLPVHPDERGPHEVESPQVRVD